MSDFGDDGNEPEFNDDFDEPVEDFDEEPHFSEGEDGGDTGVNGVVNGDHDFIASGDPAAAAAAAQQGSGKRHDDKKIPDDQRNTTPYMTKYERARLLGTRALQIRWARVWRRDKFGRWWLIDVV
jgi:DNA-directed RNA polymerase I, II, and III subunit RPABC2